MLVKECRAHGEPLMDFSNTKNVGERIRERIEKLDRVDKFLVKQSFHWSRNCNSLKLVKWSRMEKERDCGLRISEEARIRDFFRVEGVIGLKRVASCYSSDFHFLWHWSTIIMRENCFYLHDYNNEREMFLLAHERGIFFSHYQFVFLQLEFWKRK